MYIIKEFKNTEVKVINFLNFYIDTIISNINNQLVNRCWVVVLKSVNSLSELQST